MCWVINFANIDSEVWKGGGDEKFWVAWRFEDFQGQGMQTNTSVPKKNKKNQLAPAKKKDANTF